MISIEPKRFKFFPYYLCACQFFCDFLFFIFYRIYHIYHILARLN